MFNPYEENDHLKTELQELRQAIIRVDPMVMHDGRFEEVFTAPINIIDAARRMIEKIPVHRPTSMGAARIAVDR